MQAGKLRRPQTGDGHDFRGHRGQLAAPGRTTSTVAMVLLLVFTPSCRPPEPEPAAAQAGLVITGANVIDGTGAPPRPETSIFVRDGRIAAVTPDGGLSLPEGATVIDATGKFVIPGLADMHVHFGLGAPLPRQPDETEQVLARELYYGITTILQLGATDGSTESIRALRERRAAGALPAPFIYGTGGHLTLQGTHPVYTVFPPAVREAADRLAAATPMSEPVDLYTLGLGISFVRTEEAARSAVRERAAGGMDAIKITVESGPTSFGDDHPQMSVEMIRAIVDEATRHGLRVFAHVSSPDELEAALEGGAAGVVHAPQNEPLPDASVAERMAAAGFIVAPTLSLFADPPDLDDPFLRATVSEEEVAALAEPGFVERVRPRWECCAPFDDLLASVGLLHARGVPLVVGTDTGNAYVFPGYSVHRELELLVRAGLTPMEALEAATRGAAEMIGAEEEFGTIQPGRRADLLILGADPLDDIRNTRSLEAVIVEGRVVDRAALSLQEAGHPAGASEPAVADRASPSIDEGWRAAAPEDLGLQSAPVAELTELLRAGEPYPNVHAVLIAKDGRLVYEEYFTGTDRRYGPDGKRHTVEVAFDRDTLHDVRSVGKSVTSALLGIALASGAIQSLDQPLVDFFPEHADLATPEKPKVTLRHALTMSAGLDWNEGEVPYTNPANHEIVMDESEDPGGFVLGRPVVVEPGSRWSYNSGLPTVLGLAVSRSMERPFGAVAREALFEPLGITDIEWSGSGAWSGIPELQWDSEEIWARSANPAGSLWIRPRDLLKFGSLFLNGGRWNGRQVLSEEWVEESIEPHIGKPDSPREHGEGVSSVASYGYLWHHDRYTLPYGELIVHAAYGNGGQRIWVVPELDLVAVHLTGNYNIWTSDWHAESLLLERIVPWAMDIETTYRHEVGRPTLALRPGEWPDLELEPEQRARYVGVYDEGGETIEVLEEGDTLVMTLTGTSGVDLIAESEHVFAYGRIADGAPQKIFWPGFRVVFVLDEKGRIDRYEARAVGSEAAVFEGERVRSRQRGR